MRWKRLLFIASLAIPAMVLFVAAGGLVVKALWNWLLPPLFQFPQLTFWQALAMLALCRILFGGFGLHGGGRNGMRRRMAERWEQMTPEEREKFRQGMRGRWGFVPPPGGGQPS